MKLLHRYYKLTTERNWHSQESGLLGSGPIGPGSGYSVVPKSTEVTYRAYNKNRNRMINVGGTLQF